MTTNPWISTLSVTCDFYFCGLASQVGAVVTRIGEKYREAALTLVAKAYSTIRIADLAVYLGQVIATRTQVLCVNKLLIASPFSMFVS